MRKILLWGVMMWGVGLSGCEALMTSKGVGTTTDVLKAPFEMTSSSSGGSSSKSKKAAVDFLEKNRLALQEESSRGQGEHLEALAKLMQCGSADKEHWNRLMKQEYERLFGVPAKAEVLWGNLHTLLQEQSSQGLNCESMASGRLS